MHSVQVSELEIPVTIQASKLIEGTDRRELFTEATKTTIVLENGAVLCLKSSVLPGQCVFLRNEHSGKEILCKVLESRQGGLAHYTNLEFVDRDPKFWDVPAEQPVGARQTPEIQEIESGGSRPVAPPRMEPSSRAGGDIPLTFLETNTVAPVCHESTDQPEWNDAKDGELMAALIAIDTKQPAKRESEKKRATEFEREMASEGASEQSETIPDTASDAEVFSTPASRLCRTRKFTAYRNPRAVGVAAFVSMAAVLSIAHIRLSSIHSNRPSASATQSRQHAVPSPGQSSPTGGSAVAIGTPMTADAPQRGNVVPDSPVSATPKMKTSKGTLSSPKGALAQANSGKLNKLNAGEIIPAKILSQSLPSIPPWAKGLDMDGIVQLDALIDENGNVAAAKPMSGPRLLQRAAERAVALWIFQPALSDGKPTATHIVLTVEFQR